jgi:hypothetical protein
MQTQSARSKIRLFRLAILPVVLLLTGGCTSDLWRDDRFVYYYQPAVPSHLQLYYSDQRKDILVKYDEFTDRSSRIRSRCFWLEPNVSRISREQAPHFEAARTSRNLVSIPVIASESDPIPPSPAGLHAVGRPDDYIFVLYDKERLMDNYALPRYKSSSQRVKQVLLTPFAVAVDLTIIGAVVFSYVALEDAASGDLFSHHNEDNSNKSEHHDNGHGNAKPPANHPHPGR